MTPRPVAEPRTSPVAEPRPLPSEAGGGARRAPVVPMNGGSAARMAPEGAPPVVSSPAPRAGYGDMAAFATLAADPNSVLRAMQIALRDAGVEIREEQIVDAGARAETAERNRQVAIEKAAEAAEKASNFLGLPGWLGDMVKVVAVAAAALATPVTGGAAALVLAGLALSLGAGAITDAAVAVGIVSEQDAAWLKLGIEITGAALMTVAGLGAADGASLAAEGARLVTTSAASASSVASTMKAVAGVVEGVTQAWNGARGVGSAVYTDEADNHRLDAVAERQRSDGATEDMDRVASELGDLMNQFTRVARRLQAATDARAETMNAAIAALA